MKKNTLLISFLLTQLFCFSQFDLLNKNPVSGNPAYVGSTGKNRVTARLTPPFNPDFGEMALNYDLFSNKLKGGWGIHTYFTGTKLNQQLAYSPKFTKKNGRYTFAPAIKIGYEHRKTPQSLLIEHPELFFSKNELGVSLGFNVNNEKSILALSVDYLSNTNHLKSQIQVVHQFNKNKNSKFSSTFSTSLAFRREDDQKQPRIFGRGELNNVLYTNWSYAIKFKKVFLQIGNDYLLHNNYMSYYDNSYKYLYGTRSTGGIGNVINHLGIGYEGKKIKAMLDVKLATVDLNGGLNLTIAYKF